MSASCMHTTQGKAPTGRQSTAGGETPRYDGQGKSPDGAHQPHGLTNRTGSLLLKPYGTNKKAARKILSQGLGQKKAGRKFFWETR